MLKIDPWERAAECERALRAANDPTRRQILTDVRDLWIGLANARSLLPRAEFDEQVETINRIHAELITPRGACGNHHGTSADHAQCSAWH
jgi:hypothetical protein